MTTWRTAILVVAAATLVVSIAAESQTSSQAGTVQRMKGLTDVPGIRVGHHTLTERPTGCTVVLVDGQGAVGGISQRGGAPGTRETDLLRTSNLVERVNAIVLSGGSAFGLDVAQGVVTYLEEKGIGFPTAAGVVPIVPAAILFDLGFGGDPKIRPSADCGYKAATSATTGAVAEGSVGAGAGATVGKLGGVDALRGGSGDRRSPMKGGVGSASIALGNGLVVAALAAVNAVGDIIDPQSGQVVAGVRNADGTLADIRKLLRAGTPLAPPRPGENTTIAVVATNARLTKEQVNRVALMADDGLARAINPAHTPGDGDTVFALATGSLQGEANVTVVGALAAEALSEAIVRAVAQATGAAGFPSARDVGSVPARLK